MQTAIAIFHIKIATVSKGIKRPLWSVIIPTYNCANYLKETLTSVLAQDPGEASMEIIVVDDHSTKDDPEAVVKEFGKGRVKFIRQEKNVGKVKNYEAGLRASRGRYIHQLHGDDLVYNSFYKEMEAIFNESPSAGAAFSITNYIDSKSRITGVTGMIQDNEGIVPDMLEKLYTQQYIQTPSMVVKREVYETIGCFDRRLNCMEDWEMWIRIANNYPIAVSNKVLAAYRSHQENATNSTFKDGTALKTHQLICDIVDGYIDPDVKKNFSKIRNQKQAAFWLLSYKNSKHELSLKEKWSFVSKILKLDFNLKNSYRIFS
ncbi:glycosyltransferase [Flavobacteriaceae bacterium]|nr:glycosyltransferase [Flavobacteriaceae bacterium]